MAKTRGEKLSDFVNYARNRKATRADIQVTDVHTHTESYVAAAKQPKGKQTNYTARYS